MPDETLYAALELNQQFAEPLSSTEVARIANSVWEYIAEDRALWGGRRAAVIAQEDTDALISEPNVLALISWLLARNGRNATFWIANELGTEIFRWSRDALPNARKRAH